MARASQGELVSQNPDEDEKKLTAIERRAENIMSATRLIRFRGRLMALQDNRGFWQYKTVSRETFKDIAYLQMGGIGRSAVTDVFEYLPSAVEDLTELDNYILFGMPDNADNVDPDSITTIWDMRELVSTQAVSADQCIWRSPYAKIPPKLGETYQRLPFIMDLAGQDEGLYDDIMQSIAPIVMEKKPDGVIWWVGDGANGKSTLMDAIYRIFPKQLSSLTVKALVDERDTPNMNGKLANIVKESSEGRVEDTQIYKSIGTHEDFPVHKFNSQDTVEINGNLHHIFSANNVPIFNDKGHSARRRTFIIPFTQVFESDPLFEEKTFTPEFFGRLIMEICRYAIKLQRQGYKYQWSAKTLAAKGDYDTEANNAEQYAAEMITEGLAGFDNYTGIMSDYNRWCDEHGYNALGKNNLTRAFKLLGFELSSVRFPGADKPRNIYRIPGGPSDLVLMGKPTAWRDWSSFYTTEGFQKIEAEDIIVPDEFAEPLPPEDPPEPDEPDEPEVDEPVAPPKRSILNNRW